MLELLYKALDLLLSWLGARRRVRVLTHRAVREGGQECFFVNVTNLSSTRDVEITHVWFEGVASVEVRTPERPLPRRLQPDESWQTWLPTPSARAAAGEDAYGSFRVRLSTGMIVRSKRNTELPSLRNVTEARLPAPSSHTRLLPRPAANATARSDEPLNAIVGRDRYDVPLQRPVLPNKTFVRESTAHELAAAIGTWPPLLRDSMREQAYLNRWVDWRAVVKSVNRSHFGGYTLMLQDAVESTARAESFFAYLPEEALGAIERLRDGDIVRVEGRIFTFANDEIDIDHCRIISHEIARTARA